MSKYVVDLGDSNNGTAAELVRRGRFLTLVLSPVMSCATWHGATVAPNSLAISREASGFCFVVWVERERRLVMFGTAQVFGAHGLKSLTLRGRKLVPFCRGLRPLLTCPFLPMDRYQRQRVPRE